MTRDEKANGLHRRVEMKCRWLQASGKDDYLRAEGDYNSKPIIKNFLRVCN